MYRTRLSESAVADCRRALLRAVVPSVDVRDEPGGGYRMEKRTKSGVVRVLVVGGLGRALQERVYSAGPGFVYDDGPSTVTQGLRVHMHVYHIVECLTFLSVCKCRARFKRPSQATKGARAVMERLKLLGLSPVASELLLLAPAWNVATRADLVCVNSVGEFVLVSLKTGAGSTKTSGRMLRGPAGMNVVADTQRARHQVQLLAEHVMLIEAGVNVVQAQIMYVKTDGIVAQCASVDAARWWWGEEFLQSQFGKCMCSN